MSHSLQVPGTGWRESPGPSCIRLPSTSTSPHSQSIMGIALFSAITDEHEQNVVTKLP